MQGSLLGQMSSCYCCCPEGFSTGLIPQSPGFLLSPGTLAAFWLEGAALVPDCTECSSLQGLGRTAFDGNAPCCSCRKIEGVT